VRALGVVGEGLVELGVEPPPDVEVTLGFGGDAPNAAVMAALLGVPARIAGRVGDDALGRRLLAFWRSAGVDVAHVVVDPGAPTGIYVNERGAEGLQRFDYHRAGSAGSRLAPADLGPAFHDGLGVLHVTGITLAVSQSSSEAALAAVERARAAGSRISVAANHRPALGGDPARIAELASRAHVAFVSEEEAGAVFGASEPSLIAAALPGVEELVVTRGADGCLVRHAGTETARPVFQVEVVDAAGAGDALAGAYLAARLAGASPEAALEVGAVAAALSCRARGCARSYPARAELQAACGGLPWQAREQSTGGGR
jgi:2-dehydro-3-deoxygluconokinase